MTEVFYAGAYWGPRKEPPEACARRAQRFFLALARCDASLAHWYQAAGSRQRSLTKPLAPDPQVETLRKVFQRGVNRWDSDHGVMEQLGFALDATNGEPQRDHLTLNILCGADAPAVSNVCVVDLPRLGPPAERVLTAPVLTEVLRGMALAWEPDWAGAISPRHRDLSQKHLQGAPYVGWVTYLAAHRGAVPPLPAPVRVEPVEDKGTLILLTPERFASSNPEHLGLAEQVREHLGRAGLLGPGLPGSPAPRES